MNQFPSILTINMQKGGVGKSTIAKNLTTYLAIDKNKKVLNIDGDHLGSLSQFYDVIDQEGTIGEIFKLETDQQLKFHQVHENIDLISYDSELDSKEDILKEEYIKSNDKYFLLAQWLFNNKDTLSKYDFIIIDTHNDFDILTKNAIAVSDVVIAPDRPSVTNDFNKINMELRFQNFKETLRDNNGESFISARFYTVGNMVERNRKRHRQFLNDLKQKESYLTWFPNKELFINASLTIQSMETLIKEEGNRNHDWYYDRYLEAMSSIENVLS